MYCLKMRIHHQHTLHFKLKSRTIAINSLVLLAKISRFIMKKDEKLQPIQVYESDSKTKFMSYGDKLSKGKSLLVM